MEKPAVRQWDWTSAGLLFLLLQVAAARLVTTDWAPFLYFAETLASFGTVLGLMLGVSRFGRRAVFWLASAYTVLVVPWRIASAFHRGALARSSRTRGRNAPRFARVNSSGDSPLPIRCFSFCLRAWASG